MADLAQRLASLSPAQRRLLEQRLRTQPQVAQPIAVIGMSCRLPGAPNLDAYWKLIHEGRTAVQEVPADRWDVNALYDEDYEALGKMATRWCAPVDDFDQFDALFFGITPREASRMDPQQRLLLETAWEAIENAGIAPDQLSGTATGVFVGVGGTDYSKLPYQFSNYLESIDAHTGTGNAISIAANRVSYVLDLRGPSVAVDTACSSGLVAVHYAVQALRSGECDTVLAGAANLILSPEATIAFSKSRMLSPTGRCRPFDAEADGYVRGEGCTFVLLKRLTDALADGDHVLAVIRGTAVNQDGRTSGITAPNSLSQESCIRAALASAGLGPQDVSYIEAHGTGTPLGDPIEFQTLAKLFPAAGKDTPSCYVTSVKANVGHTETVSGMAGFIKVVLMMQQGRIPKQTGLTRLNPNISLAGTRLQVPTEELAWPSDRPRIAGVSSFGFGGTNTHVVIESATPTAVPAASAAQRPQHVLAMSAKNKNALHDLAALYRERLESLSDDCVADFCFSVNTGRTHFNHRVAMTADTRESLIERLTAVIEAKKNAQVHSGELRLAGRPRVAMLFTGQGSQYAGMGKGLYEQHPVVRDLIDECDSILQPVLQKSIKQIILKDPEQLIDETAYTQPALFVIEYALARLWQSWGVEPTALLGHSVGEYVAACLAGVFNLEAGLRLVAKRAALMQAMPPNGMMAVIFAERERVEEVLKPFAPGVTVATANGPENNVISGSTELVESVVAEFDKRGVGTQKLRVSHAFHSPLMDPMLDEFEEFAAQFEFGRPRIPIAANRTGKLTDTADFDAAYWRDHLRNCVEFADGISCLEAAGVDAYLEVGPAASLVGMGKRCAPDSKALWLTSLRKGRDDFKTLFGALCELYVLGMKIDWTSFESPWTRRRLPLPTYPFQRTRHWYVGDTRAGGARGPTLHPLLGTEIGTALKPRIFEGRLSSDSPRYLRDHVVQGAVVVPAAAYLEQGLAAGKLTLGTGHHAIENLAIQQALFLPAEGARLVETVVAGEASGRTSYEVFSADAHSDSGDARWQLHVTGSIVHESACKAAEPPQLPDRDAFRRGAIHVMNHDEIYEMFATRALHYGPCFRVTSEVARTRDEAIASVVLNDIVKAKLDDYTVHPAIGDAMLQLMAGVIPLEDNLDHAPYTYIPMRVGSFRTLAPVQDQMWLYAKRTSPDTPHPESVEADVFLLSQTNAVIAEARGVVVQRIGRPVNESPEEQAGHWLYQIQWQKAEVQASNLGQAAPHAADDCVMVLGQQDGLGGQLAEAVRQAGNRPLLVEPGDAFHGISEVDGIATCQVGLIDEQSYADMLDAAVDALGTAWTVIHAFAVDAPTPTEQTQSLTEAVDCVATSALRLLQQLTRCRRIKRASLCFLTRGGQHVQPGDASAVQQAPLWGFARVAAIEAPDATCRIIDLDPAADNSTQAAEVLSEVLSKTDENQVAYREGERYVARLVETGEITSPLSEAGALTIPDSANYRLRIRTAGSFDGLYYEPFSVPATPEGKVEIEVYATGLNFSDVLKAMGLYPGITDAIVPLGIECAGIVRAVGPGVTRFKVGDEVMGVAPYSFASRTVTADYALVSKPQNIDFHEAATIPITFLTAYYALVRLAQLQQGERVLIHAGAGGVGLAAIQIAKHIGAEIFATAGSEEKREFIRSLGVPHVMSSRTLDFADEIREITDRQGVDVVLNSLPGDFIDKSLESLNAYGRFLEIGKTDIYSNTKIGLLPFQDNLSYFAIDLDRMLRQRGEYIRDMFLELMAHFAAGHYRPLPFTQFSTKDTVNAFRYMAQRKNIGKIVVDMQTASGREQPAAEKIVREDATYVITGGLGALGLQVAGRLIDDGAKFVALLGRRVPSDDAQRAIDRLTSSGAQVLPIQGDVADMASLRGALQQIPSSYPPVRGIIHAAGVLADGMMFDMELPQWYKPLAPKIDGTWNLHAVTRDMPLDFFVMFSSVACVLGSPGQSNYAAGNSFLDEMVAYRQGLGLPATSINWGPWADSGMAAEAGRDSQLSGRGMRLLPADKSLDFLSDFLRNKADRIVVMNVDWSELIRAMGGKISPLLREVASGMEGGPEEASAEDRAYRQTLVDMSVDQRREKLIGFFAQQMAQIMGMELADVDVISPLNSMGMDSLMAIELKNKIERRLQTSLPMSVLIHEPSVTSLADYLAENFGGEVESDKPAAAANEIRTDGANRVVGPHSSRRVEAGA